MFLIAVEIEVVPFSDMVNNPFVELILIPCQASYFFGLHKGFSSFIAKPHFTKEILTVLASALEIVKVGPVSNTPFLSSNYDLSIRSNTTIIE